MNGDGRAGRGQARRRARQREPGRRGVDLDRTERRDARTRCSRCSRRRSCPSTATRVIVRPASVVTRLPNWSWTCTVTAGAIDGRDRDVGRLHGEGELVRGRRRHVERARRGARREPARRRGQRESRRRGVDLDAAERREPGGDGRRRVPRSDRSGRRRHGDADAAVVRRVAELVLDLHRDCRASTRPPRRSTAGRRNRACSRAAALT